MAASAALAGLDGLHQAAHGENRPYAQQQPEDFVPGKPLFYATAMPMAGYATACWWKATWAGPPRWREIPVTPPALGAANVFAQASVLSLYDPDRAQVVIYRGRIGDWSTFLTSMDQRRADLLDRERLRGCGF